jgi:hydrogenase maturation protease
MTPKVLVAGIGNIFQSDDAFGVEVVGRLLAETFPAGVRLEDFGIRGIHLAYELLEGYDALIIIDAVPMGEPAGTLAVIAPDIVPTDEMDESVHAVDAHTMSPDVVLATLARLGGSVERIYIVGCQPANLGDGMGLTPAVEDSIDGAVALCRELVADIVQPAGKGTHP